VRIRKCSEARSTAYHEFTHNGSPGAGAAQHLCAKNSEQGTVSAVPGQQEFCYGVLVAAQYPCGVSRLCPGNDSRIPCAFFSAGKHLRYSKEFNVTCIDASLAEPGAHFPEAANGINRGRWKDGEALVLAACKLHKGLHDFRFGRQFGSAYYYKIATVHGGSPPGQSYSWIVESVYGLLWFQLVFK